MLPKCLPSAASGLKVFLLYVFTIYLVISVVCLWDLNKPAIDGATTNTEAELLREKHCKERQYKLSKKTLPQASIIICFYNEPLSILLMTVRTVIRESPPELIRDVVLMDDHSDKEELAGSLVRQVSTLGKVRVLRMPSHQGLVSARIHASNAAWGEVLTFLEPGSIVSRGWLEPLLARVVENPSNVVSPIGDELRTHHSSKDSRIVHSREISRDLQIIWQRLFHSQGSNHYDEQYIRTPLLIRRNVFCINKNYFNYLSTIDAMLISREEANIGLSLKVWICGGNIALARCSHVGHDQNQTKRRNQVNRPSIQKLLTLSAAWMDRNLAMYHKCKKRRLLMDNGNRIDKLKSSCRMNCANFQWYVNNTIRKTGSISQVKRHNPLDEIPREKFEDKVTHKSIATDKEGDILIYEDISATLNGHKVIEEDHFL